MMSQRLALAGALVCVMLAPSANAQVFSLGKFGGQGHVAQASCQQCDTYWSGYDQGCGSCTGGCNSCDDCGVGGYCNRGLMPFTPCTCGGTLVADAAIGMKCFLGRTLSCAAGTVFGGLRAVSCHASNSFAALECAASMGCCNYCGAECAPGDVGGCADCAMGAGSMDGYLPAETYNESVGPTMALPEEVPAPEGSGIQKQNSDPFADEPVPAPQARRAPTRSSVPMRSGYRTMPRGPKLSSGRVPSSNIQRAHYTQVPASIGVSRYLPARPATLRR